MKGKIQEMLMGLVSVMYYLAIAFDLLFPVEADLFYADLTSEQLVIISVAPLGIAMLAFLLWELVEVLLGRRQQRQDKKLNSH